MPLDNEPPEAVRKRRPVEFKLPVDVRNVPMLLVAAFVVIYFLHWAQTFLIPVLVGILITYMLSPVVNWIARARVPRVVAAPLVLLAFIAPSLATVYYLADDSVRLLESLPLSIQRATAVLATDGTSTVGKVQQVAKDLEQVAKGAQPERPQPKQRVTVVQMESGSKVHEYLWSGSKTALSGMTAALMVLFLVIFLLTSGDLFKRKLVRMIGDTFSEKKITVQILEEIDGQIQRYMLVLLVSNVLLGLLTWVAFTALGVEDAAVWGVAAGLLHVIPYFGPALIAIASGFAAFLQFNTVPMALMVSGSTLAISAVVGMGLTTWLTGRAAHMNSASVFIGLLFWSWIWGLWGLLLGIPILVIIKVISDHVEALSPIAELLGE